MITFMPLPSTKTEPVGYVIVVDSAESMAAFAQMVNRGVQTWTDAPTEIKEFADEVISGKHMQNYRFLANEPAKPAYGHQIEQQQFDKPVSRLAQCIVDPFCKHIWSDVYKGTAVYKQTCDLCTSWRVL